MRRRRKGTGRTSRRRGPTAQEIRKDRVEEEGEKAGKE